MRMVGVPEAVIDFWIAKFLGQGYKVEFRVLRIAMPSV
jgi:hypothetical protein